MRSVAGEEVVMLMQKPFVVWYALAMIAVAGAPLIATGCKSEKGPAERAGAQIDRAADRTGDAIEDAGKKVNKALPNN
jgi:hypothetical protein